MVLIVYGALIRFSKTRMLDLGYWSPFNVSILMSFQLSSKENLFSRFISTVLFFTHHKTMVKEIKR